MTHPKALLEQFGLRPKKRFGQHFLIDERAAARIAALACAGSSRVIEIGPGTGTLTRALVDTGCDVTAIDVDEGMIRVLQTRSDVRPAHIVHADALAFDYEAYANERPWSMTGNLPYNIATPLVMRLVEMQNGPQRLVVMVQKEVALRFAAVAGSKSYGSLSVAVQYAMLVHREFTLGPGAFYPRPKIDSAVIRLERREQPAAAVADEPWFLQVVRAAFAYRRKTLANSLSLALGLNRASVTKTLNELRLDPEVRGEQLDLAAFAQLADRLRA